MPPTSTPHPTPHKEGESHTFSKRINQFSVTSSSGSFSRSALLHACPSSVVVCFFGLMYASAKMTKGLRPHPQQPPSLPRALVLKAPPAPESPPCGMEMLDPALCLKCKTPNQTNTTPEKTPKIATTTNKNHRQKQATSKAGVFAS